MKAKKRLQLQQGDVLLIEVDKIPETAKKIPPDSRGVVLAEGEVTGHYHALSQENVTQYMDGNTMYIEVRSVENLTHQEHGTFAVETRLYEVGTVVEVDPFTQEINAVKD